MHNDDHHPQIGLGHILPYILAATTILGLAICAASAAQAQTNAWSWYVVLGSHTGSSRVGDIAQTTIDARACGVNTHTDWSDHIPGFRPGIMVQTAGGSFTSRAQAQRVLNRVRPCIPDAYLKRGFDISKTDERW